jgi:hypothetical protein
MTPLIDADVLRYEIGHSGQYLDLPKPGMTKEEAEACTGELIVRNFDFVADLLDQKIKEICAEVWATEPPVLYLTNDRRMHKQANKKLKKAGLPEQDYQPNFRDAVAEKKVYKGTRKSEKPFHYDNLTAYMIATYDVKIAFGMEADDLMSIDQYARIAELDTIICSRDKDLRITPGMHYGWECGRQAQFGPVRVTEIGAIELKGGKKIIGTGLAFFYSQVLTGDSVDNIPGLPRCGPVTAYESLYDAKTEGDLFERTAALYLAKYGDDWRKEMNEQCQLLWMVREIDEDGELVKYVMFDERPDSAGSTEAGHDSSPEELPVPS